MTAGTETNATHEHTHTHTHEHPELVSKAWKNQRCEQKYTTVILIKANVLKISREKIRIVYINIKTGFGFVRQQVSQQREL